jgi:protoheme IX farnesyltransferase
VAYSLLLTAVTRVPGLTGVFGPLYTVCAAVLGGALCLLAVRLWWTRSPERAAVTFHFSLLYLALLFVAVALDAVMR